MCWMHVGGKATGCVCDQQKSVYLKCWVSTKGHLCLCPPNTKQSLQTAGWRELEGAIAPSYSQTQHIIHLSLSLSVSLSSSTLIPNVGSGPSWIHAWPPPLGQSHTPHTHAHKRTLAPLCLWLTAQSGCGHYTHWAMVTQWDNKAKL